jgi:DNA-binding response OmpR family regulator
MLENGSSHDRVLGAAADGAAFLPARAGTTSGIFPRADLASRHTLTRFGVALVVDPDPDLRRIYALLLERHGVGRVLVAGEGTEALALAMAHGPQLVLTETALPNLDGVTLIRRMRASRGTAGAVVVVITSRSGIDLARHTAELHVAMLLEKPVSFRTLGSTLCAGLAKTPPPLSARHSSRTGAL